MPSLTLGFKSLTDIHSSISSLQSFFLTQEMKKQNQNEFLCLLFCHYQHHASKLGRKPNPFLSFSN